MAKLFIKFDVTKLRTVWNFGNYPSFVALVALFYKVFQQNWWAIFVLVRLKYLIGFIDISKFNKPFLKRSEFSVVYCSLFLQILFQFVSILHQQSRCSGKFFSCQIVIFYRCYDCNSGPVKIMFCYPFPSAMYLCDRKAKVNVFL